MIERTETEAANFVCPFSRNAAQVERHGANGCIGSRCMLWVTGGHAADIFDVRLKDIEPHINAKFDPFAYSVREMSMDRAERIRAGIDAWAAKEHPGREVLSKTLGGGATSAISGSSIVRVTLKGEATGHCGVMR
jgi:hypothetical protein